MVVKLIQAGGFTGKQKYAEIDLSAYPVELQDEIIHYLNMQPGIESSVKQSSSRDAFKYILEHDHKHKEIDHHLEASPQLKHLFDELKKNLHF